MVERYLRGAIPFGGVKMERIRAVVHESRADSTFRGHVLVLEWV